MVHEGRILQQLDPIFNEPEVSQNPLDYRTHFMAPRKHFGGTLFDTYNFNLAVIWFLTLVFYITLYFDFFKVAFGSLGKIRLPRRRSS
ncbi:MAG: hypothetical protein HC913_11830 [Microscillaceae bacterium]|nr:hypothetical protein [Microscillaceae bacterium]